MRDYKIDSAIYPELKYCRTRIHHLMDIIPTDHKWYDTMQRICGLLDPIILDLAYVSDTVRSPKRAINDQLNDEMIRSAIKACHSKILGLKRLHSDYLHKYGLIDTVIRLMYKIIHNVE